MKTCAIIPTYNNVATAADVVRRTLQYLPVILVADGPTDGTLEAVEAIQDERLTILSYPNNQGKGYALKQGFRKAIEMGFTHAVTLDSDGQHFPEDIPAMLDVSRACPDGLILGSREMRQTNMPGKNSFANRFSNFWFYVQTGLALKDTQTGFRVYPLQHLHGLHFMTRRYEAELLLLVFSTWTDMPIIPVPVRVYYPPVSERISYFRPARDFTRISLLNTGLCLLAVVYGWPRRFWRSNYYAALFIGFAVWCNMLLGWYLLFRPKDMLSLRHRLAQGGVRFLKAYPGAHLEYCLAQGATPIDSARPSIFIANHGSLLDTLVMLSLSDKLVLVGRRWVTHNIFFGRLSQAMGIITVDEGMDGFFPAIQSCIEKGLSVCIFPEGTRTITGQVGRFHKGAFYVAEQLQLPIRPIVLQGFHLALPKWPFCVGRTSVLRVTIMPEIQPSDTRYGSNYKERTSQMRKQYKQWLYEKD